MSKILKIALLYFFIGVNCSDSSPKKDEIDQSDQGNKTPFTSILEEIPDDINQVENLTVYPGDSEPTHTIELIPQQVFGEDEELGLFIIFKGIEDDNGRLIIWGTDYNRGNGVFIYNPDGTFYKQLGRKGKGPGEYELVLDIQEKAGKIYVSDYTSMRLNEYSTDDYSVKGSIKFEQWDVYDGLKFDNVQTRNDENYIVAFSERTPKLGQGETTFKVMDEAGNSVNDQSQSFPRGFTINAKSKSKVPKPSMPLSFMGSTITAFSKEGSFYAVSSKEFLVKKYDSEGAYQSAFYYPVQGSSFDLDEYLKTAGPFTPKAHQIRKAFDEMGEELPDIFPFIDKMIVDDENRIWLAIPTNTNREEYEWWIMEESGELIAKLLLSERNRIHDIKNGYLYARKDNGKPRGHLYSGDGSGEENLEYVVKYKIELTEK